jgi:phosphatidylinositol alpha-1,6-mannosyltransferase
MHITVAPAAWLIRQIIGTPFVQYLHCDELTDRPRLTNLAVTRSDANIAVSSYTRRLAEAAGADPTRTHGIPPGVDLTPEPRAQTAERTKHPSLVTVARLAERYKGHDVVLRALPRITASVPDATWTIIGEGPLRGRLTELARLGGVGESARFVGALSDLERDAWLDRAHVFVMPSRLPLEGEGGEGFGIAYLEAGVHHLPVVAGNVAGAVDAVVDGETGLLVDPTDEVAVADAVTELLLDPRRADAMGRAGAIHARDYAWPRIAARVEELLIKMAKP